MIVNPFNVQLPQFSNQPNSIEYVSGRASAEVYQMQPNSQRVLFDNSKDTFYFIQTDASGIKTIKECNYEVVEPEKVTPAEYVKRSEFDELKAQIENLINMNKSQKGVKHE
jgi:hypothetical protein